MENGIISRTLHSRNFILLMINVLMFALFAVMRTETFLTWNNIKAIFSLMTYELLVAVGMTVVLILGGIDLSVGSQIALLSIVIALPLRGGSAVFPALLLGFIVALALGMFNGVMIKKFNIAPFLVTLGMMSIARGIATVVTQGQFISFVNVNPAFTAFGRAEIPLFYFNGQVNSVPVLLLCALALTIVLGVLLKKWHPLHRMFFVGQNATAAKYSGLNTTAISIGGYVLCAFFCYIAAVFMTASNRMGFANYGSGMEMRAIAAAIVGGASMEGGYGSMLGTFLGVTMLSLLNNGFIMLGGSPNWQQASTGLILLLAVAVDALINRKSKRG